MIYTFADYFDADGRELDISFFEPHMDRRLAAELLKGPVYCSLRRVPEDIRRDLASISPNVPVSFARRGTDPYRERFEITLHAEGTIRGIGGICIVGAQCETGVPGLYATGDVATRERVAGAISGGGAINAAWALSSGCWSGRAVAQLAKTQGRRDREPVHGSARSGLGGAGRAQISAHEAVAAVQAEILPYDKNIFRTGPKLRDSLDQLERTWTALGAGIAGPDIQKNREAAALTATARWCYRAALDREESRGQQQRVDFPETNPAFASRLLVGGLEQLWTRLEKEAVHD